jgi:hypothetical protein
MCPLSTPLAPPLWAVSLELPLKKEFEHALFNLPVIFYVQKDSKISEVTLPSIFDVKKIQKSIAHVDINGIYILFIYI